ncbi:MAG TPA: hypothetical protein VKP67_03050 [Xanthobacteraceae bacterium]|nr:hypothetical protein [Xanthobacteraceae bacterium]
MKTLMLGAALFAAMAATSEASEHAVRRSYSSAIEQFSYGWGAMPPLPRRYQNHCGGRDGHYICADHCGADYQIYYCSRTVTGCCHIGEGYCDYTGKLRCMPALF